MGVVPGTIGGGGGRRRCLQVKEGMRRRLLEKERERERRDMFGYLVFQTIFPLSPSFFDSPPALEV
jgi:hypothetical protein